MTHPFKLPGLDFYSCLQEVIDTIAMLREKEDHEVLKVLETTLRKSIDEMTSVAGDIAQAQAWMGEITDILLGEVDEQGKRNTDEYKKKMTGKKVKDELNEYILNLVKSKEEGGSGYSSFLQEMIDHFRTTYNAWKKHLFTCYDYKFLPNTNLELELSHSRMKRKHRKITGLKNSHRFLLNHGEHFAHCFEPDFSYNLILHTLQSADYEKLKTKTREEREKSRKRGRKRVTRKNLPKILEEIVSKWGN